MGKYREYVCETCGRVFLSNKGCKTRTPRFCSPKCAGIANAKMKVCAYCGKEFYNWTREKFCCKACASAALGTEHPPLGIALIMQGEHLCKTMRGVKKPGLMSACRLEGVFRADNSARAEFLAAADKLLNRD